MSKGLSARSTSRPLAMSAAAFSSGDLPGEASLRHQQIRRDILDSHHPEAVLFENAADPGQQMIVAAPESRPHTPDDAKRSPVEPNFRQRRPHQRADENQIAAVLRAKQSFGPAELADRNPVMAKARRPPPDRRRLSARTATGLMPRAVRESATANGMTPPPAIKPTGDEISEAAAVMAPAAPSINVCRARQPEGTARDACRRR